MKKPTFFISSTIYDFSDLRSAIKYYLESQGCKVLASEYNDFEKPLDKHSYDACLESIKQADYFILLIGTRIGGWYDKTSKVSITQREYREAYSLQNETGIKILNFVRKDVWQYRDINKELAKYLETIDLNPDFKTDILERRSKYSENATFIKDFIDEIGKNKETMKATQAGTDLPTSNWVHVFSSFKEIIDVLSILPFIKLPINEYLIHNLLKQELKEILRTSLINFFKHIVTPKEVVNNFINKYPIKITDYKNDAITVELGDWKTLFNFGYFLLAKKFSAPITKKVLTEPIFTKYDKSSNELIFTPVFNALYKLDEQIRRFAGFDTTDTLKVIYDNPPIKFPPGTDTVSLNSSNLASLITHMNILVNIIELSKALFLYFSGNDFTMPELQPISAVFGMSEKIEEDIITEKEILEFINK